MLAWQEPRLTLVLLLPALPARDAADGAAREDAQLSRARSKSVLREIAQRWAEHGLARPTPSGHSQTNNR